MRMAVALSLMLWLVASCDSPRRPPVDARLDVEDVTDVVDVQDAEDVKDTVDVPDGWPPRENCSERPVHGLNVGSHPYFFSVPYTTGGMLLFLGESGNLYTDGGRICDKVYGVNIWQQDILRYDLVRREETELVVYPARQFNPNEYQGKVYFTSAYADYQVNPIGSHPWEGIAQIWVWDAGDIRPYSTWCPMDYACSNAKVSRHGKMVYYTFKPYSGSFENTLYFHDLETLETREVYQYPEAPVTFAVGDLAIFWNHSPCGSFQYYDIEEDRVITASEYQVFATSAWGDYIAWNNCVPTQNMVINLRTQEVRNLDDEMNLDPANKSCYLHTGYDEIVALVDRVREVPEPGQAAHLWLYDLQTRVQRRITSEAAKWTWGSDSRFNCQWAVITLDYGKNGTTIRHYPKAALNLVEAGILDENCRLIPGPPLEFTLEEFISACGFTLENYTSYYD